VTVEPREPGVTGNVCVVDPGISGEYLLVDDPVDVARPTLLWSNPR
jgi:hypothetical protein